MRPNIETHLAFGEALEEAMLGVVKIFLLICVIKKNNLTIDNHEYMLNDWRARTNGKHNENG